MARVFVVGDSHARLLGTMLLEAARPLGWQPAGLISNVGWSTGRYKNESDWRQEVAAARPDIVVIILGTNDAARGQQAYVSQLRSVVDGARASGARGLVWIGPPSVKNENIDTRIDRIAPWQEGFLPQMQVKWVDSRPFTYGGHSPDGVHFTREGYRAWATALIDDLRGMPRATDDVPVEKASLLWPMVAGALIAAAVFILKPRSQRRGLRERRP